MAGRAALAASHAAIPALFAGLIISAPAKADSAGWEFNVVPYLWTAGVDGRLSHRNFPLEIEASASFGDILKRLDIGGMVAFEGRRGRWGFVGDAFTVGLSDDSARIPVLGVPIGLKANTTSLMGGAQFRVVDDEAVSLDLLAGVRFWSMSTRFDVSVPEAIPLPPGIQRTYSARERAQWPDVMVGAKASMALAPTVHLNGMAMIGGGGASLSSDLYAS
ncbi:MAG: hypothetical protein ACK4TG_07055, partial [Thermaurantiacus sp.]